MPLGEETDGRTKPDAGVGVPGEVNDLEFWTARKTGRGDSPLEANTEAEADAN